MKKHKCSSILCILQSTKNLKQKSIMEVINFKTNHPIDSIVEANFIITPKIA